MALEARGLECGCLVLVPSWRAQGRVPSVPPFWLLEVAGNLPRSLAYKCIASLAGCVSRPLLTTLLVMLD